ncbi:MAG: DUF3078 domain-containing protein [Saprospiraceae bacterium]|nr:DUF3078 domain-containing protein [Saprospiraceae bacterium]
MKKFLRYLVPVCFLLPSLLVAQAGDDRLKELQQASAREGEGWVTGGALGLDFAQLLMVHPRVGSGDNRIAFGGLGNLFANYKRGKTEWQTNLSLQLAVQQLADADWQKSLDMLRLNSKYSYQTGNEKWAYAALLTFESLSMPTYPGNFLKKQEDADAAQARFLSPARLEFSPGIQYKPDAHWNFFLAPVSYKLIYVGDQDIANLGIHGTRPVDEDDLTQGYEQAFHQAGARFVAGYTRKFLAERMTCTSRLDLFSNYLDNPQNLDVLWQTDLGWQLWKNLSLNLLVEAFYDHDILVLRKRPSESLPDGELGRQTSWTQALMIKYNVLF